MPDSPMSDTDRAGAEHPEPDESDAVATTEAYEIDEGVVFYDAQNPLAWMQARATLDLHQMV